MANGDVNLDCKTDDEILERLKGALRLEQRGLAEFLRVLAEVEERRLHVERGFSSMFAYCVAGLGLSEDQAYRRVAAARAGRRFPVVLQMIADGALHMSGVAKMAKHFTEENHRELLDEARGKTKAEVEKVVAAAFPQPNVRPSIRKVPAAPAPAPVPAAPVLPVSLPARSRPPVPVKRTGQITPTSSEAYAVRFTATAKGKQLLDRARDLLGPKSQADIGQILELGLAVLVEKLEKKKCAKTDRPRKKAGVKKKAAGDRYVPAEARRIVHERDRHRCTYVSNDGRGCSCTYGLQLDHIIPVAHGGRSITDNLRLRCAAHNIHAAEQIFGREKMDRHRKSSGPGKVDGPRPQPSLFDVSP